MGLCFYPNDFGRKLEFDGLNPLVMGLCFYPTKADKAEATTQS